MRLLTVLATLASVLCADATAVVRRLTVAPPSCVLSTTCYFKCAAAFTVTQGSGSSISLTSLPVANCACSTGVGTLGGRVDFASPLAYTAYFSLTGCTAAVNTTNSGQFCSGTYSVNGTVGSTTCPQPPASSAAPRLARGGLALSLLLLHAAIR